MSMEIKHPHLKKLLIVFLVVFVVLVSIAGMSIYRDMMVSEPNGTIDQSASGMLLTDEAIKRNMELLDNYQADNSRMSMEEAVEQLRVTDGYQAHPDSMRSDEASQDAVEENK